MSQHTISTGALRRIAGLVSSHAGLKLPTEKLWLLERRVSERQRQLATATPEDYVKRLEGNSGREELDALIEALRVGETRFFRLGNQERALRRVALPELWARRGSLRVWSAGCASGEEPYTVAMIVDDWIQQTQSERGAFEILATDFSSGALGAARKGSYDHAAVEAVPPRLLERYFERDRDLYRVGPAIRQRVKIERHNLVGDPYPSGFDLVVCRNVLIYFDRRTQEAVIRGLTASLSVNGFIFLGTSDLLQPTPGLTRLKTADGPIYQRTAAEVPPVSVEPDVLVTPPETKPRDQGDPNIVRLRGSYGTQGDSQRLAQELRDALAGGEPTLVVDLDGATYLADDCARVLHRLAGMAELVLVASRPGVKRWVHRHRNLFGGVSVRDGLAGVGGGD